MYFEAAARTSISQMPICVTTVNGFIDETSNVALDEEICVERMCQLISKGEGVGYLSKFKVIRVSSRSTWS